MLDAKTALRKALTLKKFEALWVVLVLACLCLLIGYQSDRGAAAAAPQVWPTTQIKRGHAFTLVMLAHPQCPCTRASLRQLQQLADRGLGNLRIYVVFVKPEGTAADFHLGDLWDMSRALPGVISVEDDGGRLAKSFGTFTSGQILLYGPRGELKFAGGITPSRGHEGDSIGLEAIELILAAKKTVTTSPVYGCSLISQQDAPCHP